MHFTRALVCGQFGQFTHTQVASRAVGARAMATAAQ